MQNLRLNNRLMIALSGALFITLVGAAPARATPITQISSMEPNHALIDFESFAFNEKVPIVTQGATLSSSSPTWRVRKMGYTQHPGIYEGQHFGFGIATVTIVFDKPVSQIGTGVFDPNYVGNTAYAYDKDGNLLESFDGIATGPTGGIHSAFVGFIRAKAEIKTFVFQGAPGDWFGIDNVRFSRVEDSDGDGVLDPYDICPGGDDYIDYDSDGVPDYCDNCPSTANADQADFDADGKGDVCDGDTDGDGVFNSADACPATPVGAPVLSDGCSVDQFCVCDAPWKNHGKYVVCVTKATNKLVKAGKITGAQKGDIVSKAGKSNCGKPRQSYK